MRERTYWRDLSYLLFHRKESARRFIDEALADILRMRDIDGLEYCYSCNRPLALIETKAGAAYDVRIEPLRRLAEQAGLPVFVVFYRRSKEANPIYAGEKNLDGEPIRDIAKLTVVNLAEGTSRHMQPAEFFGWLLDLHLTCSCTAAENIRRRLTGGSVAQETACT